MDLKNYIAEARKNKQIHVSVVDHSVSTDDKIFTPVDKDSLIRNTQANTMYIYALKYLEPLENNQRYLGAACSKEDLTTEKNPIFRIATNVRKYIESVINATSKSKESLKTFSAINTKLIEPFFLKIIKNPKKKHDIDAHIIAPLIYLSKEKEYDDQTIIFLTHFLSSDQFRNLVSNFVELTSKFAAKFG